MIDTTLANKYNISRELFSDKLGTCFYGTHVSDGYGVAVHVLDSGVSASDEQLASIFAAAEKIHGIGSPTLCPAIDSGLTDGGARYIVSAMPDAVALSDFAKGGIALPEALNVAFQCATGIGVAAQEGVPHKGLSAGNVLVSTLDDGTNVARITGWGFDALLPEYATGQKDDKFYGTPEYMPPELCSGKGWSDQGDIYSLGILTYQMITGKPPFISSNFNTTLKRQIYEKPLPLHLLKRGIAHINEFEKIIFRALQKLPAKRTDGLETLAAELRDFREQFAPETEFAAPAAPAWPAIEGLSAAAPAPAAETAAEPEEESGDGRSQTMMFTGIGQMAQAEEAVAETDGETEEGDTLRMGDAPTEEAPESDPEPVPEPDPEPEAAADAARAETQMMESVPAAAEEKPAQDKPEGDPDDEDWFVDSPQELSGREVTESWAAKKQPSNIKFYVIIGAVAVVVAAAIVYLISTMGTTPPAETKTERTPSAEAQRKAEAEKAAEARKREAEARKAKAKNEELSKEEELRKIKAQAALAAEKEKTRRAKEEAEAKLLAEKAKLESQRKALQAQQDLLKFNEELGKYRKMLKTKKQQWQDKSNLVKVGEINELMGQLAQFQTRAAELTIPESGAKVEQAVNSLGTIRTDFATYSSKADGVLAEDVNAPAEVGTPEDALKKAEEEAAAAKLAEEEAAAAKLAEEEAAAAKLAEEEAAAAKLAEEEAAAKKAEEEAAAKKAEEDAAAKKLTEKTADSDAAKKKAEAEAKKKKEAEAKKKKEAEAKKKKAEAEAKKKKEEEAKKKKEEKKSASAGKLQKEGMQALKNGKYDSAISAFNKAKDAGGNAALLNKLIAKAEAQKKKAGKDDSAKKKEEEAKKKKEEEAKKKAEAEAKKKKEEEAKKKAEAEAKKKEEAEAKKKAEAEAKKKKEAEAKKKKEEKKKDAGKAAHLQKMGMKAMKAGNKKLAVKYFQKAKSEGGNAALLDKLIKKCSE